MHQSKSRHFRRHQAAPAALSLIAAVLFFTAASGVLAGDMEPPPAAFGAGGVPRATMVTLQDVYDAIEALETKVDGSCGTFGGPSPGGASVARTGQLLTFGPNDDGTLRTGVPWPFPQTILSA